MDLTSALDSTLSPLFLGQLKNLHKLCLSSFKKELLEGLKGEEYNFAEVVKSAKETWETKFKTAAVEAVVEESPEWNWEEESFLLKDEMSTVADQCRKDETKKMVNVIEVCSER